MPFRELDVVAITVDLPEHGLKAGDMGAVVQVYAEAAVEVEFVTAAGTTRAVVTLQVDKLRTLGSRDMLSVQPLDAA